MRVVPVRPKKKSKKKVEPKGFSYDLRRPCSNCPFRTDIEPYIRTKRAREIIEGLDRGIFSCHKTVDHDALEDIEDYDGPRDGEKFCAGALILMCKQEMLGQMGRIALRLRMFDPDKLDMDAPVFSSSVEFIDAQIGGRNHPDTEKEEHDPCHCVGPDCEYPAGYMMSSGPVRGDSPPEALTTCWECSEPTCDSCLRPHPTKKKHEICLDCLEYNNG